MHTPSNPARRSDLDLLRALVVVGLVFFHTATIFDLTDGTFYIKNAERSLILTIVVIFTGMWGMPLLFFVSGMGIWHALGRRSPRVFIAERVRRLLVPWLFGVLTLVPLQIYLSLRSRGQFTGSFAQYLPTFFTIHPTFDFPWLWQTDPGPGEFEQGHLWFLWMLLVYALLVLPLCTWLRSPRGQRSIAWLAAMAEQPGRQSWAVMVALPGLLVALAETLGQSESTGGWNRAVYLLVLLAGFVLAADQRFTRAMQRQAPVNLLLGLLLLGGVIGAALVAGMRGVDPTRDFGALNIAFRLLKGFDGWLLIVGILGLGNRLAGRAGAAHSSRQIAPGARAARRARLIGYATEAVLPFYILHEPVVVVLAYVIVRWQVPLIVKYLAISLPALLLTLLLYELLIRRIAVLRFLFGMKPPAEPQRVLQPAHVG